MKRLRFIFFLSLIVLVTNFSLDAMKRKKGPGDDSSEQHQGKKSRLNGDLRLTEDLGSDSELEPGAPGETPGRVPALPEPRVADYPQPSAPPAPAGDQKRMYPDLGPLPQAAPANALALVVPSAQPAPPAYNPAYAGPQTELASAGQVVQDRVITNLPPGVWRLIILYLLDTASVDQLEKMWNTLIKQMPTIVDCVGAWQLIQEQDFKIPLNQPYPIDLENVMTFGAQADVIESHFLKHIKHYNQNCLQEAYLVATFSHKEEKKFENILTQITEHLARYRVIEKDIVYKIATDLNFIKWLFDNNRIPTIKLFVEKYLSGSLLIGNYPEQVADHEELVKVFIDEKINKEESKIIKNFLVHKKHNCPLIYAQFQSFFDRLIKKDYGNAYIITLLENNYLENKEVNLIPSVLFIAAKNGCEKLIEVIFDTKQNALNGDGIRRAFKEAMMNGHVGALELMYEAKKSKIALKTDILDTKFVNKAFEETALSMEGDEKLRRKSYVFMLKKNLISAETARNVFVQGACRQDLEILGAIIENGNHLIDDETLHKALEQTQSVFQRVIKLITGELRRRHPRFYDSFFSLFKSS